ncbi:MAG: hypothetical protein ACXW4G_11595 [Candidatus Deferrimicrobiaceae bacterium]
MAHGPRRPPVDESVELLAGTLEAGDVVVDGGNWGLAEGYCLMVGEDEEAFRVVAPVLETLAPPKGYAYMGPHDAGHFVKMVHNGIEYGMMQSYAEGFELLSSAPYSLDLRAIASLWNQGSVVRSWLPELDERGLEKDQTLSALSPYVDDSGEGRWTVERSIEAGVPLPSIALSLYMRFFSRQDNSFAMRMLAALRNEFGGHAVKATSTGKKKGKRDG